MSVGLIALASMICFSVSMHEILIVVFITLTAPVTFMLLGRAAIYRDRNGGDEDVPSAEQGERDHHRGPCASGLRPRRHLVEPAA